MFVHWVPRQFSDNRCKEVCKLVDESIVTDQLKWAMLSLEQRLTNMTLGMLQIECNDVEDLESPVTVLAVDDYRLVSLKLGTPIRFLFYSTHLLRAGWCKLTHSCWLWKITSYFQSESRLRYRRNDWKCLFNSIFDNQHFRFRSSELSRLTGSKSKPAMCLFFILHVSSQ